MGLWIGLAAIATGVLSLLLWSSVLGALGGAKVGHEVERRRSEHVTGYRVDVKLDNGGTHSVTLAGNTGYSAGQRVRLVDGQLAPA